MLDSFAAILSKWLVDRGVRVDELLLFPAAGHQYTHSHPGECYGHYLEDRLFFAGDVEAFTKHLPQLEEAARSMFEFYELLCDDPYVSRMVRPSVEVHQEFVTVPADNVLSTAVREALKNPQSLHILPMPTHNEIVHKFHAEMDKRIYPAIRKLTAQVFEARKNLLRQSPADAGMLAVENGLIEISQLLSKILGEALQPEPPQEERISLPSQPTTYDRLFDEQGRPYDGTSGPIIGGVGERVDVTPCGELDLSVEVYVPGPEDRHLARATVNECLLAHEVQMVKQERGFLISIMDLVGPASVLVPFLAEYGDVTRPQDLMFFDGTKMVIAKNCTLVEVASQVAAHEMRILDRPQFMASDVCDVPLDCETSEPSTASSSTTSPTLDIPSQPGPG